MVFREEYEEMQAGLPSRGRLAVGQPVACPVGCMPYTHVGACRRYYNAPRSIPDEIRVISA